MPDRHINLGLVGQDIAHSLSPYLHSCLGEHFGYHVSFKLIDCSSSELMAHMNTHRFQNYRGLNVTTPYKNVVYRLVDQATSAAQRVGAVNTLKYSDQKLIGHNTDSIGVAHTLNTHLSITQVKDGHALIIGVGPASKSAACALISKGIQRITWLSRRPTGGQEIIKWSEQHFPSISSSWLGVDGQNIRYDFDRSVDLLISGAPPLPFTLWSQMSQQLTPFLGGLFGLNQEGIFLDLNYGNQRTHGAKKFCSNKHLNYIDGTLMLLAQGVASFLWWNHLDGSIETILSQCNLTNKENI